MTLQETGAALIADTLNDLHYLVNAFDANASRRNDMKLSTRRVKSPRAKRRKRNDRS